MLTFKDNWLSSGVTWATIGTFIAELVSYIALAIPVLIGLLKLYREFMLASDEHRRRKKEFGDDYKPKIGDFMRKGSRNMAGGTNPKDRPKPKPPKDGNP